MAQLGNTAQQTMDLYYQHFRTDQDFFRLVHFRYLCAVAYASLLQDYYEKSYARALSENGMGDVDLPTEWMISETLGVQSGAHGEHYLELKQKPFSFLYDNQFRSIQTIMPVGDFSARLFRISIKEVWKLRAMPQTRNVFWFSMGDQKIQFRNMNTSLSEVMVFYLPSLGDLSDEAELADGLEGRVIEATLNLMSIARQGGVVDMTNDQNPNRTMETEVNNIFRGIKTKP
jgi:hypothetical protein